MVDGRADDSVAADFEYRRGQKQDDCVNALQRVGHGSELQVSQIWGLLQYAMCPLADLSLRLYSRLRRDMALPTSRTAKGAKKRQFPSSAIEAFLSKWRWPLCSIELTWSDSCVR